MQKDYFTGSAALAAAPQTTKAGLFYRWDKEEEEKRKEEEKVREKREEEDGKKNVGKCVFNISLSMSSRDGYERSAPSLRCQRKRRRGIAT